MILRYALVLLLTWPGPGTAASDYVREVTLAPSDLPNLGIELTVKEIPRQLASVTLTLTPEFTCNLENASVTLRDSEGHLVLLSELAVKNRSMFFLVARSQLQTAEFSLTCRLAEPRHYDHYILRLSA